MRRELPPADGLSFNYYVKRVNGFQWQVRRETFENGVLLRDSGSEFPPMAWAWATATCRSENDKLIAMNAHAFQHSAEAFLDSIFPSARPLRSGHRFRRRYDI